MLPITYKMFQSLSVNNSSSRSMYTVDTDYFQQYSGNYLLRTFILLRITPPDRSKSMPYWVDDRVTCKDTLI